MVELLRSEFGPNVIVATATLRASGKNRNTEDAFLAGRAAVERLVGPHFEVISAFGDRVTFQGTPGAFTEHFGVEWPNADAAPPGILQQPEGDSGVGLWPDLVEIVERVRIPPLASFSHTAVRPAMAVVVDLDLPEIRNLLNANAPAGATSGIKIVVIDSGAITRVAETKIVDHNGESLGVDVDHDVVEVKSVSAGGSGTGTVFAGCRVQLNAAEVEVGDAVTVEYSCFHPYYVQEGFDAWVSAVHQLGDVDPGHDKVGHGTIVVAELLNIARGADVEVIAVQRGTAGALDAAIQMDPHIIVCCWGLRVNCGDLSAAACANAKQSLDSEYEDILDAVVNAHAAGITVVFAGGNSTRDAPYFEDDDPNVYDHRVIAPYNALVAGGTYAISDSARSASPRTSSFMSHRYPHRTVPDFTGIAGLGGPPNSFRLTWVPTQPDCGYDQAWAWEAPDEEDDGWAAISSSSQATAEVAGAAAVVLGHYMACDPSVLLSPDALHHILEESARDVTTGRSASGDCATPGWDPATGYGLLDVSAACGYLSAGFIPHIRPGDVDGIRRRRIFARILRRFFRLKARWASPDIAVLQGGSTTTAVELGLTSKHVAYIGRSVLARIPPEVFVRIQNRGRTTGDCDIELRVRAAYGQVVRHTLERIPVQQLGPGEFRVVGPAIWEPAPGRYVIEARMLESGGTSQIGFHARKAVRVV